VATAATTTADTTGMAGAPTMVPITAEPGDHHHAAPAAVPRGGRLSSCAIGHAQRLEDAGEVRLETQAALWAQRHGLG
jgi:hypothetical protein